MHAEMCARSARACALFIREIEANISARFARSVVTVRISPCCCTTSDAPSLFSYGVCAIIYPKKRTTQSWRADHLMAAANQAWPGTGPTCTIQVEALGSRPKGPGLERKFRRAEVADRPRARIKARRGERIPAELDFLRQLPHGDAGQLPQGHENIRAFCARAGS
jgi:hypothetical protein